MKTTRVKIEIELIVEESAILDEEEITGQIRDFCEFPEIGDFSLAKSVHDSKVIVVSVGENTKRSKIVC